MLQVEAINNQLTAQSGHFYPDEPTEDMRGCPGLWLGGRMVVRRLIVSQSISQLLAGLSRDHNQDGKTLGLVQGNVASRCFWSAKCVTKS